MNNVGLYKYNDNIYLHEYWVYTVNTLPVNFGSLFLPLEGVKLGTSYFVQESSTKSNYAQMELARDQVGITIFS